MSKKILAGVLAAASILSVSAVASAEAAPTTKKYEGGSESLSYNVNVPVSYGTVDVTVPTTMEGIVVNPYYAAVKTSKSSTDTGAKNKNFIAAPVFEIVNNSTTSGDGIEVYAITSVTKATSLVVVDADANEPTGWKDCVDAKDATKKVNAGENWNRLYTYDKITSKVADKTKPNEITYTGGAYSAKQGNNVAIWAVGKAGAASTTTLSPTAAEVCLDLRAKAETVGDAEVMVLPDFYTVLEGATDVSAVAFHAKGTNTGSLGKAKESESVFYTVVGQLSDKATAADPTYAWGKESLSLNVALKIVPVDSTES